jgi:hypothetical protein
VPIPKLWDFANELEGRCINVTVFFYFTSAFSILTDFWILALPIRTLLGIQRATREKVILIGIFLVGIFACICSIVRLYSIRVYTQSTDPFYDAVPINTWSMVEVNVALICASVPSIKPLVSSNVRNRFKQESHGLTTTARGKGTVRLAEEEGEGGSTTELNSRARGIYKETEIVVSSIGGRRSTEEV